MSAAPHEPAAPVAVEPSPATPHGPAGPTRPVGWRERWRRRLERQLAYVLTASGAFLLGITLGLVLGLSAARPAMSPPPISGVLPAESVRFVPLPTATPEPEAAAPAPEAAPVGAEGPPDGEIVLRATMIRAPEGFSAANLRTSPAVSATSLQLLPNGTRLELLEGTAAADNYQWARVRTAEGHVGWVVTVALANP